LALFLGWVILGALAYIPIAGIIIYTLGMLVMVILWIICLIASLSEETKKIIILTELAEKLSF
ncbi:MAG: hypothetical protein Q8Q35_01865, partial [Nanoarchaeota archaeon]|nr:hypothetical protein [Nanoarchaeota archaeon]